MFGYTDEYLVAPRLSWIARDDFGFESARHSKTRRRSDQRLSHPSFVYSST